MTSSFPSSSSSSSSSHTLPRLTVLLFSILVTLGSGTNYAYSAYAPQLGTRLNISHTQLNFVGLAGNLGVYTSGPLWGRIVDLRGPRILFLSASILLFLGYSGIKIIYDAGIPEGLETIETWRSVVLIGCGYMTGAGGNAGLTGSVNSVAKSFGEGSRATTTGLVISGFGLSAFIFSSLSTILFSGNPSAFLRLLSLGTALPMILGFFFVRPVPIVSGKDAVKGSEEVELGRDEGEDGDVGMGGVEEEEERVTLLAAQQGVEIDSEMETSHHHHHHHPRNIHGRSLLHSLDFWLLFWILSILAGIGLTYINNVGLIAQSLYISSHPSPPSPPTPTSPPPPPPTPSPGSEPTSSSYQSTQVSTISLCSFLGRIFIGLLTDYLKTSHSLPRSYSLVLVSSLFLFSQVLSIDLLGGAGGGKGGVGSKVETLWVVSATLGVAYGCVFSLAPNVCLDWFGIEHFSENWGYLAASPIILGNVFSIIFGKNLDAHDSPSPSPPSASPPSHPSPPPTPPPPPPRRAAGLPAPQVTPGTCKLGLKCYVNALYLTTGACLFAVGLCVWAAWRERRRVVLKGEGGKGR